MSAACRDTKCGVDDTGNKRTHVNSRLHMAIRLTSTESLKSTLLLQGALDAAGACCNGVVDSFGVCNGYDASGTFQVALSSTGTASKLATALGISTGQVSTSTE